MYIYFQFRRKFLIQKVQLKLLILTLRLSPSIASEITDAETVLVFLLEICGSGPIVSKNVDGSGKLAAGIAVAALTVGTLVNVISWGILFCMKDVVIFCVKSPVDVCGRAVNELSDS